MKYKFITFLALLAIAVACVISYRNNLTNDSYAAPDSGGPNRPEVPESSPDAFRSSRGAASAEDAAKSPVAALIPNEQVKETRRMVAAHASLRAPEVADPDSETNRRIMQQMVLQAFENAKTDSK